MRYCPNCGAEYLEGIEECADCRLPLTDEPPEPEDEQSLLDRLTAAWVLRGVFGALVLSAAAYALIGVGTMLFFVLSDDSPDGSSFDLVRDLNEIQTGLFRVAIACVAILGGAVLVKRYEDPSTLRLRPSTLALRTLFWIVVLFSIVWAVTGIATSRIQTEQSLGLRGVQEQEETSESDLTLLTLQYAAYVGGTAAFAVMAGMFMVGQARPRDEGDGGRSRGESAMDKHPRHDPA